MKVLIPTGILLLLLGTTASTYARQEKGQEEHPQESKPAQQHAKPAQQQHAQQGNAGQSQARAQQSHPAGGNGGRYGRISDAHYAASIGSGHRFQVNQSDYEHRRFQYGGYSFGFIDPWPVGWSYSDDVYVVYVFGGYYMYDPVHPGLRISISIF
jgi:hypothetical protein